MTDRKTRQKIFKLYAVPAQKKNPKKCGYLQQYAILSINWVT